MLKVEEIIGHSVQELEALHRQLSEEIFRLSNELRMSKKLEKPHELKEKKKDRARVLTALNQKRVTG